MITEHPGYRARNIDVAKIYGITAGLIAIKERMTKRKDCPMWFVELIDDEIRRASCLQRPLINYRDELPKTVTT